MITVTDKLKSFSEKIIDRVREESEEKINEYSQRSNELLGRERKKAINDARSIVEEAKIRAESERQQIISRAEIDRKYALLKKKKEIFFSVIEDIKNEAERFTIKPAYLDYLEKSIELGISKVKSEEIMLLFKTEDLDRYRDRICGFIREYAPRDTRIKLGTADDRILGGCICQNGEGTFRVDCSMAAVIDDNLELIGKILMDNLAKQVMQ